MAEFHFSHEVCSCKKVTLGEIVHAIKEKDAKSLDQIEEITDAGSACGCCKSPEDDFGDPKMDLYISQILNKFA
jgi:NAD(P)H-nitrite reductase large subunit